MPLPYLNAPEQTMEMISQFGGYNHRLSISETEFFDMKNMSSKDFPLASTREKRGLLNINGSQYIPQAKGIVAENSLIVPYIGHGDVGVTISQAVEAQNAITIEKSYNASTKELTINASSDKYTSAALIDNELYTKISDFKDTAIVNAIKGTATSENLIKSKFVDDKIQKVASGFSPEAKEDGLYLKYPHGKINAGLFWTRTLVDVNYAHIRSESGVLGTSEKYIVSVEENDLLADANVRNALIDAEVYVGSSSWKKTKILCIEELSNAKLLNNKNWGYSEFNKVHLERHGKWTITVENPGKKEGFIKEKDTFVIAMTDPLADEISERKDATWIYRQLNPPTEVSVSALTPAHLRVLTGKTVAFSKDSTSVDVNISQVDTTDGAYKIWLDRPHSAIPNEATASGDRLFFLEYDPATGETTTSDIFSAVDGEHQLIEMGANLVVFPEKVVVNTLKKNVDGQFNDIQELEFKNVIGNEFAYQLCDINGNVYSNGNIGNTAPSSPKNGEAWIDNSQDPPVLKVWSKQTSQWAVTEPYVDIYTQGESSWDYVSESWKVGDAIEIEFPESSKIKPKKDQKYFVISATGKKELTVDGEKKEKKFIRIQAMVDSHEEQKTDKNEHFVFKRTLPEMDFVVENENRLWGCKYGIVDGEPINEIFACKLGDPKNWHHFTNTTLDSYYVNLGADGKFTGAASFGGNPIFFREDCMHRIYGNYPANYSVKTYDCHGVEAGSEKGIAVINDVLFYKSPVGIMAYTGATPVNISETFGTGKYKNAIACALGDRFYVSMTDEKTKEKERVLFVFDDSSKLWHKEDNLEVKDFVVFDGEAYALTESNSIVSMTGVNGEEEEDFEWFLESGKIGFTTPYRKRISRINIRALMELDSRMSISSQYDSSGYFEHIANIKPSGKVKSIAVPISPRRCDHFALKISGKGDCKILSITKVIEGGSDDE